MRLALSDEERPAVPSPVPLASRLPSVYQLLDPNILAFNEALDQVISSAWLNLDNFASYVNCATAPNDFLEMLGAWIGLEVDDNWDEMQKRRLLEAAADLQRRRGTLRGLKEWVRAFTGVEPEVTESGGTICSTSPRPDLPGRPNGALFVRVPLAERVSEAYQARVLRIVAEAVPAHVSVTVEVTVVGPQSSADSTEAPAGSSKPRHVREDDPDD